MVSLCQYIGCVVVIDDVVVVVAFVAVIDDSVVDDDDDDDDNGGVFLHVSHYQFIRYVIKESNYKIHSQRDTCPKRHTQLKTVPEENQHHQVRRKFTWKSSNL